MDTAAYTAIFLLLLAAYLAFAAWARLDPRYPLAGGILLLLAGAALDREGYSAAAEILGVDAFLLLLGGMVAMVLTGRRPGGLAPPPAAVGEPVHEGQPEADPALHDLQQHPVPVVDGTARPDDEEVDGGHGEAQDGQQ